jgi:hypothetical protein
MTESSRLSASALQHKLMAGERKEEMLKGAREALHGGMSRAAE